MKVTYTIWVSDNHHITCERNIDSYDLSEIHHDFEKVLDLRSTRADLRLAKALLACVADEGCSCVFMQGAEGSPCTGLCEPSRAREFLGDEYKPLVNVPVIKSEPAPDFGPHKSVGEYDGAFWCTACDNQWGALPGDSVMPTECKVDLKKMLKKLSGDERSKRMKDAYNEGWYSCPDVPPNDHPDICGQCLECLSHDA